jgi:hypothetical protein
MRNNSLLTGLVGIIGILIGIGLFWALRGPTRDGNPVGFDVMGQSGQLPASTNTNNGCLEKSSCTSAEIHYVKLPPGPCPSVLVGKNLCTTGANATRALPTCPPDAQCISLKTTVGSTVALQDDEGFRSFDNTEAQAIIILK